MGGRTLLLSIHPHHADRIFDGTKTTELRRTRPKLNIGDQVLVYVSTPVQSLGGGFEVSGVVEASPAELWSHVRKSAAVSSEIFDRYFNGATKGYAIQVSCAWRFSKPISLRALRTLIPAFQPPQVFRYLTDTEVQRLGIRRKAMSPAA